MPRTAIMCITRRCNLRCVFCLERDAGFSELEPSTDDVAAELDRLRARGTDHITFMGAETFLRKDLADILAHARSVGLTRVGVVTNGTIVSKPGFLAPLVEAGLAFVELSIHAHTRELAAEISGKPFTFDRQQAALRELRAAGLSTIVNVVLCRPNRSALQDIVRYISRELGGSLRFVKLKHVGQDGAAIADDRASMSYADGDPIAPARWLLSQGVDVRFGNVPLCRLADLAHLAQEAQLVAVDERYFGFDHHSNAGYYDSGYQWEERVWPREPCERCTLRPVCPGIERRYAERFGTGDLAASSTPPESVVARVLADRPDASAIAAERVAALRTIPRPDLDVPRAARLALTREGVAQPMVLEVEPVEEAARAYFRTRRFALSYGSWTTGDPFSEPLVVEALRAASTALAAADASGLDRAASLAAIERSLAPAWSVLAPPAAGGSSPVSVTGAAMIARLMAPRR